MYMCAHMYIHAIYMYTCTIFICTKYIDIYLDNDISTNVIGSQCLCQIMFCQPIASHFPSKSSYNLNSWFAQMRQMKIHS
jgi:hypothetical protein